MGLVNDVVGTGRSGVFLGLTVVVAVVTYNPALLPTATLLLVVLAKFGFIVHNIF